MKHYYAGTNEFNGRSYRDYHVFDSKKERDTFVSENANAFILTSKEFNDNMSYMKRYWDVGNFSSKVIEH